MRWVRSGRSRRRRWLVAGVAVILALVAGTGWLLSMGTYGEHIARVLALPITVVGALTAIVSLVVTIQARGSTEDQKLADAARELAYAIQEQEAASLARLVANTGDVHPADVEFAQPKLVYWRTNGGDQRGSLDEIKTYYKKLEGGRLVILGEAGAGKTVLAIKLICDLAAAIVNTPPSQNGSGMRVMVPVRLSLPAFDPAAGENNPDDVPAQRVAERLAAWLARHLVTVYGYAVAEKTASALVDKGWVLPVLDGLDEMDVGGEPPRRARAVLRAVNHLGLRPVVLTCRTEHYAELTGCRFDDNDTAADGAPSTGPASMGTGSLMVQNITPIVMEPLTPSTVRAHLIYLFPHPADSSQCAPQWRPVVNRLDTGREGDALVAALQSPLRLFLATTGYQDRDKDPNVLTWFTSVPELDDHLLELLVPAVTEQHHVQTGSRYRYSASDVQRWLTTLAHYLHREDQAGGSGSDLRLDQLWVAAGNYLPRYLSAIMLTAAVAIAVLVIDLRYLIPWGLYQNVFSTTAALWGVGLVAATVWGSSRRSVELQRIDLHALRTTAGRRRLGVGLAAGLLGSLVAGLAVGLVGEFTFGHGFGLAVGIPVGIGFGLAFGLTFGLEARPTAIDRPRRLVSQGLVHTAAELAAWLTGALVFGLTIGRVSEFTFGYRFGPTSGLAVGLAIGLAIGVFNVARAPWPRYTIACLLLAMHRKLPLRPAVFLDWAYDAGLMRLSGIAVQFRHREFQHWLTAHHPQR